MKRAVHQSVLFAALTGVLLAGAGGCGRESGSTGSASDLAGGTDTATVDACSLVTDAEASSLVGEDVQHGEDSPLGCPYAPPGKVMSLFTVRVFAGKGAAKDNFGQHSADTTIHEISGVGDSAAALARDEHVNFLIVQNGRRYIQFVTTFVDDLNLGSPKLKQAQDLALTALGRIK